MEHKQHYSGLSEQEVKENRAKFGDNVLTPPIQTPIWKKFIAKFNDPLIVYHVTNILVLTKGHRCFLSL